jgi:hypothetical protein
MEVLMLCYSDADGQQRIALDREMISIGRSPDPQYGAEGYLSYTSSPQCVRFRMDSAKTGEETSCNLP